MAKPRVHEIAKEVGITSKELLSKLNEMGEYVRGPSSTLESPVVRKIRETLGVKPAQEAKPEAARPTPAAAAKPSPAQPAAAAKPAEPTTAAPVASGFAFRRSATLTGQQPSDAALTSRALSAASTMYS